MALNALESRIKIEIAKGYHATIYSPVCKTLLQDINKVHFSTWSNLTVYLMKHLLPSMAMSKLHMKQIRKNINSTKTLDTTPIEEEPMETLETRSNHVFTEIINTQQRIAIDLNGRFPVTSNRGNKYIFSL